MVNMQCLRNILQGFAAAIQHLHDMCAYLTAEAVSRDLLDKKVDYPIILHCYPGEDIVNRL